MPNSHIAVLFDRNGQPVDCTAYDKGRGYSWEGPQNIASNMEDGDRLQVYRRRPSEAEVKEAVDKVQLQKLEDARQLLREAGELPHAAPAEE